MKKLFVMVACFALLSVSLLAPCFAGTLNLSGRAGIFNAPGGAGTSMMYGVAADYGITENISVRAAVETTSYTVNNQQTTYTPITLDLIYGQRIGENLFPYVGAGASSNSTTTAGVTTQTTGAQAEAGIRFALGGFSAGIEYRYLVPDLNDMNTGNSTYHGYATGTVSQSFNL